MGHTSNTASLASLQTTEEKLKQSANSNMVRTFLQFAIMNLVDDESAVKVDIFRRGIDGTAFRIHVKDSDIGKVIGKEGRTIRSLRTLLLGMSGSHKTNYALDFEAHRPVRFTPTVAIADALMQHMIDSTPGAIITAAHEALTTTETL